MTSSAWRHGWRIVRAKPVTFAVYLAHYLAFYTLPLATGLIMRAVFDALTGHAAAGPSVWSLFALVAAAEITRLFVISSTVRFGVAFHMGVESRLRGAMLGWLVSGRGRAAARASGETVSRFRDDVDAINDFMEAWIDLSGEMLLSLGALAVMFSINAVITSTVVVPLIAVVAATDRLSGRIQRLRAASREAAARVAGFIGEAFGAVSTIRVAGAEDQVVAHLDDLNEARRRAWIRDRLLGSVLDGLRANIAGIGIGVVLLLAAGAMRQGSFTVGDFALFASYVTLAGGGPRWIGFLLARRRQADVSIRRMDEVMDGAPPLALTAPPSGERLAQHEPLTTFAVNGLTYRYPGGARGVFGADLFLQRGDFTVITGRVGAGKTTLLRCLLGLLPADSGEFRWNNALVSDLQSLMVPPRCAYAPQAPRLFSESLRDNIAMGHAASDPDIATAVEMAALDVDIRHLGAGLDTVVGSRGVTLSGGQLHRAAAARMFVRSADLMVFDDLSSALDVVTEQQLWRRLTSEPGLTCLAVSHRREAFRRASEIIVMDDGRVVARGTLQTLLHESSLFAEIWARQRSHQ
ncbi:MAG: ATP-binding cassette domain-containing protein [Caulobacterales bacterium]